MHSAKRPLSLSAFPENATRNLWATLFSEIIQTAPLPNASHAVSMPGALREDVMLVSVTRDGQIYFGSDQIDSADLSGKIKNRLKDRGVERKVYINADLRARWGGVKQVLDVVRSAGILRVAFLVNQRAS
jgi:biopolymer transport protein ExbD